MDDNTNAPEFDEAAPASGTASPPVTSYHSRDTITQDRTGELLKESVETARQFPLVRPGMIEDPRDGTKAQIYVTNNGVHAVDPGVFDAYRMFPLRRKGTVRTTRLPSFIDATNRFKDDDSALFACDDPERPSLTAVLDYNPVGPEDDNSPRFGEHRVAYDFPMSPEWKAWFGKNAEPMAMIEFAEFLEDRIVDVLQVQDDGDGFSEEAKQFISTTGGTFASPSKLIEIARGMQVYEQSNVKETRNLSSGEAEITFDTVHTDGDGKPLKLPNLFVIAIPVFARANEAFRMIARLRYRKRNGGLVFWYELWRPDLVFEAAFTEAVEVAQEGTKLPLYYGKPEA